MLISRYGFSGARPHLYGANISNLTLNQLQGISGSVSIAFDGYTYSGSINLSGVTEFLGGGDRDSKYAQFERAGSGHHYWKFDRAGLGFLHRFYAAP